MGKLTDAIANDLKQAMKNKEKEKLEALRALKSAFLLAKSEKGAASELSDDDELKIVQKLVKQRKDSAEIYKQQNRSDLSEKESAEVEVLSVYLPAQLSDTKLEEKISEIIAQTGAKGPQDMGKVMGLATKSLAGVAEGKVIAQKVKSLLAGL